MHDEAESGFCYFAGAPKNRITFKQFSPNINLIMCGKMDGTCGPHVCDENHIKIVDIIFKLRVDRMLKMN